MAKVKKMSKFYIDDIFNVMNKRLEKEDKKRKKEEKAAKSTDIKKSVDKQEIESEEKVAQSVTVSMEL